MSKLNIPERSPFSHANFPFGVYSTKDSPKPRCCSRLGDYIIDLPAASRSGIISVDEAIVSQSSLNDFAALGNTHTRQVREQLQNAFSSLDDAKQACLVPVDDSVRMHLPFATRDYTDFLCSHVHAENMSRIMLGKEQLPPGFGTNPIAYHGRASSLIVSGTEVVRPYGTVYNPQTGDAGFAACKALDYEIEMGYFIAKSSSLGSRVSIQSAPEHIFGLVIVNDWSARDHQTSELGGLGPFNSKNFATTVSPWVVTLDALAPFVLEAPPASDELAPHVRPTSAGRGRWFNVDLSVAINDNVVSRPNLKDAMYSPEQMLAHHTVGGCPVNVGDLLATGTVSSREGQVGCLGEQSQGGKQPFDLGNGEKRAFLLDGDVVKFTAMAGGRDSGVGWGECTGQISPATPWE